MKQLYHRRDFAKQAGLVCLAFSWPFKINTVMDPKGVMVLSSAYSVKETIDRLQQFLQQHGAIIYARINQQEEAVKAGLQLPPLEFILFGNPKIGGAVMAETPLAALDLPLKVIAWEEHPGKVKIAYNKASYLEERYSLSSAATSTLDLEHIVAAALANK